MSLSLSLSLSLLSLSLSLSNKLRMDLSVIAGRAVGSSGRDAAASVVWWTVKKIHEVFTVHVSLFTGPLFQCVHESWPLTLRNQPSLTQTESVRTVICLTKPGAKELYM